MGSWRSVAVELIAGAVLCGATPARGEPGGTPAGVAEGTAGVVIVDHSAYWASLYGIGVVAGDVNNAPGLLVVRGTVANRSGRTLDHVELSFELLDANGRVVAVERGYNRSSEMLRAIDSPFPWPIEDPPQVSIPKDGTDSFRMLFLRNETPEFATYRVRVLAAAAGSTSSPSRRGQR